MFRPVATICRFWTPFILIGCAATKETEPTNSITANPSDSAPASAPNGETSDGADNSKAGAQQAIATLDPSELDALSPDIAGESIDLAAEIEAFDVASHRMVFDSFIPLISNSETEQEFEKESDGRYRATSEQLKTCQNIPISHVWHEFSPFFDYKWDDEFERFATLFLTIWKRESLYALPKRGVIVQPNCRQLKAKLVKSLPGKSARTDLVLSRKKDLKLSNMFKGCKMHLADYGSMQWNYHWRLKRDFYRSRIEKALLIASAYKKSDLKSYTNKELAGLVKYNPRALFILAGLELKREAKDPQKAFRNYNTKPEYVTMATRNYNEIGEALKKSAECTPLWKSKKK